MPKYRGPWEELRGFKKGCFGQLLKWEEWEAMKIKMMYFDFGMVSNYFVTSMCYDNIPIVHETFVDIINQLIKWVYNVYYQERDRLLIRSQLTRIEFQNI